MYVIKVGSLYLTSRGTFSERQSDAMRIDLTGVEGDDCRLVRLRPSGTRGSDGDGNGGQ